MYYTIVPQMHQRVYNHISYGLSLKTFSFSLILFKIGVLNNNVHYLLTARKCYCEGHCPDGEHNGTCDLRPGGQCFSAIEEYDNEIERTYGCLPPDERGLMQVSIIKILFCLN